MRWRRRVIVTRSVSRDPATSVEGFAVRDPSVGASVRAALPSSFALPLPFGAPSPDPFRPSR